MGAECRAGQRAAARYRPRRPGQTALDRCIREHFETWLVRNRDGHDGDGPLPAYVVREYRRYLECGVLVRDLVHLERGDDRLDHLRRLETRRSSAPPWTPRQARSDREVRGGRTRRRRGPAAMAAIRGPAYAARVIAGRDATPPPL